jgi:hypothetical protein
VVSTKPGAGSKMALKALAEFAVIVVGVLAAFAVDDWATDRADRADESRYLTELLGDVRADSAVIERQIALLATVRSRLAELAPVARAEAPVPVDTITFLRQVAGSHIYSLALGSQTTFQELLATGSLRLIQSTEVRSAVIRYYRLKDVTELRGQARASGFGDLVRSYLPEAVRRENAIDAEELIRQMGVRRALEALRTEDFESGMNRHLNYLDDMEPALDELLLAANSLILHIDDDLVRR